METSDSSFAGSIPEIYQKLLVPLIFEGYAADLAERLSQHSPQEILETAAGTGVVTRAMLARVSPNARLTVTDLNEPMLQYAKSLSPQGRLRWQKADALALPFSDQSFDAVICQFGVMFFPDRIEGYKEALRVLKPGGQFYFNVWDAISENDIPNAIEKTLATCFPENPPRFLSRTPYAYHDIKNISRELEEAGFGKISSEPVQLTSQAMSVESAVQAFCWGTPLRNEIEARGIGSLEKVTAQTTDALAKQFGTGPIQGRIRARVFMAQR